MRSYLCTLLLALLWATPLSAKSLEIQLIPQDDANFQGALVEAAVHDAEAEVEPRQVVVDPTQRRTTMDLREDHSWNLRVSGAGIWTGEAEEVKPGEIDLVTFRLWPAGAVTGTLHSAETLPLVPKLRLFFTRVSSAPGLKEGESRCTVERQEDVIAPRFHCSVPAGNWNLVLKMESFTPVHRWDIDVERSGNHELGSLKLSQASALVGQVLSEAGPVDTGNVRVTVSSGSEYSDGVGSTKTTRVNEQGFFVVQGLVGGLYEIVAEHPDLAPARAYPIQVMANRETLLAEPLVLKAPTRLRLHLEPNNDPFGKPWQVTLTRSNPTTEAREQVASGLSGENGNWESQKIPIGTYALQVRDSRDNRYYWERNLILEGREAPLWIDLPVTRVQGAVLLGDDPVEAAVIHFGGRSGARRVTTESGEGGEYSAFLPDDGTWRVDVFEGDPPVHSRGLEVDVKGPEDTVNIELPDTVLRGSVVSGSGTPVIDATVIAVNLDTSTVTRLLTDNEGEFMGRGLVTGNYRLSAERGEETSRDHVLQLREEPGQPVTLVLSPRLRITGRLLSGDTGVPGVPLLAMLHDPGASNISLTPVQGMTDASGSFSLLVPEWTKTMTIYAFPTGHGLTVRTVAARDPLVIQVSPSEGTLIVSNSSSLEAGFVNLLEINRTEVLDTQILVQWTRMHEGQIDEDSFHVPAMPAGSYRLCTTTTEEAFMVLAGLAQPVNCTDGILPPGGVLELRHQTPSE